MAATPQRVDSRWWYWVAAAPILVALWAVSSLWVAALSAVVFDGVSAPDLVAFPALAIGLPTLAVAVVVPYALHRDARAARERSDWRPNATPYVAATAACLLAVPALAFLVDPSSLAFSALAGLVAIAWAGTALHYLDRRRRHVATNLDGLRE